MKIVFTLLFLIYGLLNGRTVTAVSRGDLIATARHVKAKDERAERERLFKSRVEKVKVYLQARKSPLANSAESLVRCADTYGLSPSLIVGISKAESSYGLHYQLSNNPWNWGVHLGITFRSMEEGACTVARGLSKNYDLTSPWTIGRKFAPASDGNDPNNWARTVQGVINELDV